MKHEKRARLRRKIESGKLPPLQDRRAFMAALGKACDVWVDCNKGLGHFGGCQPAGEHVSLDERHPFPECRINDHWARKVGCL